MNWERQREALIDTLIREGIENPRVLAAMLAVPRHLFVPKSYQPYAYQDSALAIAHDQTISQPFVVARMTEIILKNIVPNKVLEIGTGSGYQAAVLSKVFKEVYTIERIAGLADSAKQLLEELHYNNIHFLYGDGRLGWPNHAPYDAIIVTAGAEEIPPALLTQLADPGVMIIPVGSRYNQALTVIQRHQGEIFQEIADAVVFVPLKSGKA